MSDRRNIPNPKWQPKPSGRHRCTYVVVSASIKNTSIPLFCAADASALSAVTMGSFSCTATATCRASSVRNAESKRPMRSLASSTPRSRGCAGLRAGVHSRVVRRLDRHLYVPVLQTSPSVQGAIVRSPPSGRCAGIYRQFPPMWLHFVESSYMGNGRWKSRFAK